MKNILANRIDAAGVMISYDEACKKVLANKIILAWILKYCVKEFHNYGTDEIAANYIKNEPEIGRDALHADETAEFIAGMNTEDVTMNEGTVTYDIKFRAVLPDGRASADMIVNVESQNDFYPGYPIVKRGIYYGSRMISSQYGTVFQGSRYEKLKKVYSIWLCPQPPVFRQNTITVYHMVEESVCGTVKEPEENYDLITVVMVCLGGKGKDGCTGLLKMLDVLFSEDIKTGEKKRILQEEFQIPMTRELEGEVEEMCNLSKGVYERGYQAAYQTAYEKAINTTTLNHLQKMMQKTGRSLEECMDILEVPDDRRESYREALRAGEALV